MNSVHKDEETSVSSFFSPFLKNEATSSSNSYKYFGFVDEVGRGCIAGPVVTGCVLLWQEPEHVLSPENVSVAKNFPYAWEQYLALLDVKDSKKLSEQKRAAIVTKIQSDYVKSCAKLPEAAWNLFCQDLGLKGGWHMRVAVAQIEVDVIESCNILQATLMGMGKAVEQVLPAFSGKNNHELIVWVDGKIPIPAQYLPRDFPGKIISQAKVKADLYCKFVSLASIFAKVYRDQQMKFWDEIYQGYSFGIHKGYGTELHLAAIKALGACPLHRLTFKGVKDEFSTV